MKRSKRNLMVFLRPVILADGMGGRVSLDKYDLVRGQQLQRNERGVRLQPNQQQPILPDFDEFERRHRDE
ncbi:MAG: hypothetical protein U5J62_03195 [Desulfurivibrio sp.]|nr:hypothetical protein [Desulfurivibrio sp.]